MAFAENFDAYLTDFGALCTIGGAAQVGIFDKAYLEQYGIVAGNTPVLLVKDTAAASVVEGTAVVVHGTSYRVAAIEPDGTGMTLLRLEV